MSETKHDPEGGSQQPPSLPNYSTNTSQETAALGDRSGLPWDGYATPDLTSDRRVLSSNPNLMPTTLAMASHNLNGDGKGGSDSEAAGKSRPQVLTKRGAEQSALTEKIRSPTDFLRRPYTSPVNTNGADPRHPGESLRGGLEDSAGAAKDKRKGVSLLSRIIGTKKKEQPSYSSERRAGGDRQDLINEHGSETSDLRPEGMDANLFSRNVDNLQFNPRHPQPPEYVKVHVKYKKSKDFDHVFLAQQLSASRSKEKGTAGESSEAPKATGVTDPDAIWALKFSKDGKYLAAGGQDKVIRVWVVLSSPEERREFEKHENAQQSRTRLNAPVFQHQPYREYRGHEGLVVDLDWSKNNFLLSSSYDKTVRLWHVSRRECLCTFKHPEHVFSACFHPGDDRFFLAGCRDMKLRFWSIPDKSVAFSNQLPDIITAVTFTPDGKTSIAGTCGGVCSFFETQGLKYQSQIHVRSAHGKNARGSKICSIEATAIDPGSPTNTKESGGGGGGGLPDVKVLISSADSRIRLYSLRDKTLETKLKGHKAEELPIHANLSDCGRYIVAGSEDRAAYIWSTRAAESESKPGQRPVEYFDVSREKTTAAILAPVRTKKLLAQSEDPIYDLCNPPPITLISRSESINSSRPPTESGSAQNTPTLNPAVKRPTPAAESPVFVARNAHPDGHIIVAASSGGAIRVFRQDCAFAKRRASDGWETGSVFSTQKRPSTAYMARAMGTSRRRSDSASTQPPQDRILSWRQGVGSSTSLDRRHGSDVALRPGSDFGLGLAFGQSRSASPQKSLGSASARSASRRRDVNNTAQIVPMMAGVTLTESPTRLRHPGLESHSSFGPGREKVSAPSTPIEIDDLDGGGSGRAAISASNPLMLSGGKSYMFWDPTRYLQSSAPPTQNHAMLSVNERRPRLDQKRSKMSIASTISKLSSEEEPSTPDRDEEMVCRKCQHRRIKPRIIGGATTLVCERCGTPTSTATR